MFKGLQSLVERVSFSVFSIVILGLSALLAFGLMLGSVKDETYDIRMFHLANETIRATKTVEDPVKTEQERQRAASEVTPVYDFDEEAAQNSAAVVRSVFDYALDAKAETAKDDQEEPPDTARQISDLRKKLEDLEDSGGGFRLSDDLLGMLVRAGNAELEKARDTVSSIVSEVMEKPVRDTALADARNESEDRIRTSAVPPGLMPAAVEIGRSSIIVNEKVDEQQTEARIEQAKAEVEPTRILQGQVIVQEGQIIDREVHRQLELAGLLNESASLRPVLALGLFTLLIFWFIYRHFRQLEHPGYVKKKWLSITLVVYFLTIVAMKLLAATEIDFNMALAYVYPTALVPFLLRLLTDGRMAILLTILTAATGGLLLQEGYSPVANMEIVLYILFGGFAGHYLIQGDGRRSSILTASFGVSVVNALFITFYLLMTQSHFGLQEWLLFMMAALGSGLLSGALTIGLMPFFETVFGILSDLKLVELSNPNHPLLKRILTETPGTYHHSVMVANLSDAACEAIGANGLLARVGSYYHDIGKTRRPAFFIENQMAGTNPHDSLPPEKSRDIIIAHSADGAEILEKHGMPKELVDIARQHHGTTLLKYFLVKAREAGENVDEEAYRYPGPKPQTKEIAVISIADSCEAAVRSMKEPTPEKIEQLVRSIIRDKMNDGQFSECDLSFRELNIVGEVICTTLNGVFHNRIEYPK
ncbi:putative domain HDIG [Bhargavaea cecembensis DSE10]|uniref:Putative domain HDIG n=1 Tax=Bhargavaea cecembensis DSE10 TaxID=1235279 RepID=M7P5U3_9BACL|nr:HD family phosphohydrolase [Bhargavaea cecembensis]EMR05904.1 putative domain HDIG [Bhargavaea cecembensis DSE10]